MHDRTEKEMTVNLKENGGLLKLLGYEVRAIFIHKASNDNNSTIDGIKVYVSLMLLLS